MDTRKILPEGIPPEPCEEEKINYANERIDEAQSEIQRMCWDYITKGREKRQEFIRL